MAGGRETLDHGPSTLDSREDEKMRYIRTIDDVNYEELHHFAIGPVFKREEGEKCELIYERVAPRSKFPANRHPDIFQLYIILHGRARVTVEEETAEVGPGSAVLIPRNASHYLENPYDEAMGYFCVDVFPEGPAPGHETWDRHWAWVRKHF